MEARCGGGERRRWGEIFCSGSQPWETADLSLSLSLSLSLRACECVCVLTNPNRHLCLQRTTHHDSLPLKQVMHCWYVTLLGKCVNQLYFHKCMLSVCGNVCVGVCVCVCMLPKKNSYPHMTFNLKINAKPVPCALSLDFSWFLNGYMALQKKKKKKGRCLSWICRLPPACLFLYALFKTRIALLEWFLAFSPAAAVWTDSHIFFFLVRPKLGTCAPLTQLEQQPLKPQVVNITEISPVFGTINR